MNVSDIDRENGHGNSISIEFQLHRESDEYKSKLSLNQYSVSRNARIVSYYEDIGVTSRSQVQKGLEHISPTSDCQNWAGCSGVEYE